MPLRLLKLLESPSRQIALSIMHWTHIIQITSPQPRTSPISSLVHADHQVEANTFGSARVGPLLTGDFSDSFGAWSLIVIQPG